MSLAQRSNWVTCDHNSSRDTKTCSRCQDKIRRLTKKNHYQTHGPCGKPEAIARRRAAAK